VRSATSGDTAQPDGAFIIVLDQHQKLIFKAALQSGYDNVISQLLKCRVDLNIRDMGRDRETPLLWAVKQENFELVRLFLESGAMQISRLVILKINRH
jgi:ankyrin repeat protein